MTRFSRVLLFRIFPCFLLFIFLLFIFNLSLLFQEPLFKIKRESERRLGERFQKEVFIERMGITPTGELILEKVAIPSSSLTIKKVYLRFEILPLLLKKRFNVCGITLIQPQAEAQKLIFGKLPALPEKDIAESSFPINFSRNLKVSLRNASLSGKDNGKISFDSRLILRADQLYSQGKINLDKLRLQSKLTRHPLFEELPKTLHYRARGYLEADNFHLDELALKLGEFEFAGRGKLEDYPDSRRLLLELTSLNLNLEDFSYLQTEYAAEGKVDFSLKAEGNVSHLKYSGNTTLPRANMKFARGAGRIDNLRAGIEFSDERIVITRLDFFLNDFPLSIRGEIENLASPALTLKIISFPGQIPEFRRLRPFNFECAVAGIIQKDAFGGNLQLQIESEERKTEAVFDNLRFSLPSASPKAKKKQFQIKIEEISLFGQEHLPILKAKLKNFAALASIEGKKLSFDNVEGEWQGGALRGSFFLDPPRYQFLLSLKNADVARLSGDFFLDYNLTGTLNGEISFDSIHYPPLKGTIRVSGGSLEKIKLIEQIANFLKIDSLKKMEFDTAGFSFTRGEERFALEDFFLNGKKVKVEGNFSIYKKDREMAGNILARLDKVLLRESPKLRMLLFLLGDQISDCDFEFKVVGFSGAPRIKWLEGKFREKLMFLLRGRGQKILEEELEKAIAPLLEG